MKFLGNSEETKKSQDSFRPENLFFINVTTNYVLVETVILQNHSAMCIYFTQISQDVVR